MDRTERLSLEQPKKEVPLKTSHDKMDLVELPKFINFGCDMGLLGDPDNFEPMSPKPDIPPKQKASTSDEDNIKDVAKEVEVQLEWAAKKKDIDAQEEEEAEQIAPSVQADEIKPSEKVVPTTTDKTAKETEVKVVERKPSVEKRPESRGKKNWTALRKSISQVRCIMHYVARQLLSYLVV